MPGTLNIP